MYLRLVSLLYLQINFGTAFVYKKMFFKGLGLKKLAQVSTRAFLFFYSKPLVLSIAFNLKL